MDTLLVLLSDTPKEVIQSHYFPLKDPWEPPEYQKTDFGARDPHSDGVPEPPGPSSPACEMESEPGVQDSRDPRRKPERGRPGRKGQGQRTRALQGPAHPAHRKTPDPRAAATAETQRSPRSRTEEEAAQEKGQPCPGGHTGCSRKGQSPASPVLIPLGPLKRPSKRTEPPLPTFTDGKG